MTPLFHPGHALQRVLANLHLSAHARAAPSKNSSTWAHALTTQANGRKGR